MICCAFAAVKAGAQIDRLASEKDLRSRRQGNHPNPRKAARTRRSAFSLAVLSTRTRTPSGRSISITPTRSAKATPAPRTRRDWHCRALTRRIGDDTELNKFRRPHSGGSRRHRCGLPRRSPIVQQACRNPVPASNHRNLPALGLYLG
jgi:hypothetical protein